LNRIFAAHLANIPEWEVKFAFSLHMWLDAEHSAMLRKLVTEMMEPPLHLDKVMRKSKHFSRNQFVPKIHLKLLRWK
jgi:hypothetical protein